MKQQKQEAEVLKEDFYCTICEKFNCDCLSSDCFKLRNVKNTFLSGFKAGQKSTLEQVKKLLNEIGKKFYYHSDIDGVSLRLEELEEYKDFKKQKLGEIEK